MGDPIVRLTAGRRAVSLSGEPSDGAIVVLTTETPVTGWNVFLYGYEYEVAGTAYSVFAESRDAALADIAMLQRNRGIAARLIWREVTVTVTGWR